MADFETAIQQAVDVQDIPGCVLHATNRDGSSHLAVHLNCAHTYRHVQLHQDLRIHLGEA